MHITHYTHTHKHTHIHTYTHNTHKHIQTNTHAYRHKHIHKHTEIHTHTEAPKVLSIVNIRTLRCDFFEKLPSRNDLGSVILFPRVPFFF
ncbi:rCG37484 [Rattus norvegicus]|uniref:RCG37484 n=1 Tax=Rattus norvegicus TaxID=10116 RepID=A6KHL2_RAT|nr:rCG37484 [Rattus norvegicus]